MLLTAFPLPTKATLMTFNITMRVFLSLGDVSAVNYLYEILKGGFGDIDLVGITDERLESLGVESVGRVSDLSVVGLTEVVPRLLRIRRIFRRSVEELRRCDVLIACDAPGFNLRLIREARKAGVRKVIYFISPQVWAWKPGRARTIAEFCDHLIVILPFEVEIYRRFRDLRVHYVGHPLVDMVRPGVKEEEFRRRLDLKGRFVNLMPGSRWSEIKKHVPLLREVVKRLGGLGFVLPTFPEFEPFLKESFSSLPVRVITERDVPLPAYSSMFYSEISLIASGTSSLEASLAGNPHVVFYKVSPLTYLLGRLLVRVPFISLPNIVLGREVVPELINEGPERLAEEAERLLTGEGIRERQREAFRTLRERLGGEGVLGRLRDLFRRLILDLE